MQRFGKQMLFTTIMQYNTAKVNFFSSEKNISIPGFFFLTHSSLDNVNVFCVLCILGIAVFRVLLEIQKR